MSAIQIQGRLDVFLMDAKSGEIVEERHTKNTIVDGGEIWVAELLAGEQYDDTVLSYGAGELGWGIQYCHVGSNTDATTQGMFKMQSTSGITGAANSYYVSIGTADVASPGNEVVLTAQFATNEGNGDLTESGLFSNATEPASSTDTTSRMFNRVNFATISKDTSFTLTFEWHITVGTV